MQESKRQTEHYAKEPFRKQNAATENASASVHTNPAASFVKDESAVIDWGTSSYTGASVEPPYSVDSLSVISGAPVFDNENANHVGDNPDSAFTKSKHGRRRKVLITIFAVVLVLVAVIGFCGFKVYSSAQDLRTQAKTAVTQLNQVQASLKERNYSEAASATAQLKETASSMSETTNTPWWRLASFIPYYGDDVSVAKTLVNVLDDVTSNALIPLSQTLESHPPETLVGDGTIDIENFKALMNGVQTSIPVIKRNAAALETMPEAHVDQLASVVGPIKEKFLSINDNLEAIDAFAPILATLLGADGDRLYLIVAQNSAETRSTDGFPGAMGTLAISGGNLSFGDFDKCVTVVGSAIPDRITITDAENELFGYEWMHFVPNIGYNPDFPRVASIWAAAYESTNGQSVDGVISLTPAIIQDLLTLTGGITLSDGTHLDGTNATKVLQSDLYWEYFNAQASTSESNEIVDELFAEVAASCVHQLFHDMNSSKLLGFASILKKHVEDHTAMLWLASDTEQQRIDQLDCSGALNSDPAAPKLGTYFNACSSSKLGWYADMETTIGEPSSNDDGTIGYTCITTFRNVITYQEVSTGSSYLVGKAGDGNMRPWIYITAPAGGIITDFATNDGQVFNQGAYKDLQVWYIQEGSLSPGSELTCTYTVTVSKDAKEPLGLSATPMLSAYR